MRNAPLHYFLLFVPFTLSLSWDLRDLFRSLREPPKDAKSTQDVMRISHQAASDPHQDVLLDDEPWFDGDGTPLFYSAWRVKAGPIPAEPVARSTLMLHGARVACWPSAGGVWIKEADVVDMEFLDVDRFQDTPKQFNQALEDDFCTKLKMTGASWWSLPPAFEQKRGHLEKEIYGCSTLEACFEPDIRNEYLLAWPETETTTCYVRIAQAKKVGGEMLKGYRNAMDMDERCGVIMKLGGRTCYCKDECPDLHYLDWDFRDPGSEGCSDPGLPSNLHAVNNGFHPKQSREVVQWADRYCERNGWKKG
jgi:hypothetical protein